jgi:type IV pilus assembly protein PilA
MERPSADPLGEAEPKFVAFLNGSVLGCAYFAGFHSSAKQATPGKMAFGVKVSDLAGARIGVIRGIGRYFALWLSTLTLGIGCLMAGEFTQKKQALHDMIAGTLVVNAKADSDEIVAGGGVMPVTAGVRVVSVLFIVVFFVVPVLAAILMPAYQDYKIRARVSEAVLATSRCRTSIAEIYQTAATGTVVLQDGWGCGEGVANPTQCVASISTSATVGVVTVTLSANPTLGGAAGKTFTLTPIDSAGNALTGVFPIQVGGFTCAGGGKPMPAKYLPGSCR